MSTTPQSGHQDEAPSFEAALTQLESLVGELENGQLGLDESVARFRQATELAGYCKYLIANAQLRVSELQEEAGTGQEASAPSQSLSLFDGDGDGVPF